MLITRIALSFAVCLASFLTAVPMRAAGFTVTDSNLQGWSLIPNGTVPYGFVAGPASTGLGSLQLGPIDGGNPANQFRMETPLRDVLSSSFVSFSYDLYVDPTSSKGSQYIFLNVFVDSAANGVGTLASTFDCRYDFATPAGLTQGDWHARSFGSAFNGWVSMGTPMGTGTCPTTIGELPTGSRIMSIVLNAGGATAADAGFVGGFDNVVITTSGNVVDTYDFEPLESVPEPGSLVLTGLTLALLAVRRSRS